VCDRGLRRDGAVARMQTGPAIACSAKRCRQRPATRQPPTHRFVAKAEATGPVAQTQHLSVHLEVPNTAVVPSLDVPGSPANVTGFVVPVVIDAINLMQRGRPSPHVRIERLEGFQPTAADGNVPAAVTARILRLPC
jgi:hypothetical protein